MSRTVEIALVGAGEIGTLHARAHAATAGTRLRLVCDVHPEQARQLAGEVAAEVAASFEAVLEDPTIEGVDLCVPNHLHRKLTVQALQAGKHVLCEKPIALTLEDADAMLAAARQADRLLMIGHLLRFWPEYVLAQQAVAAGQIGQPLLVSARRMISLLAGTPGADGWRRDPARSGGAVIDMQAHDLDFFCWLFGPPEAVYARGVCSADGALNHVFTTVDFAGGARAFVEASFMLQGNPLDIQFHILGSEASIAWRYAPAEFALHGLKGRGAAPQEPSLVLYRWGRDPLPLYTPQQDCFSLAMQAEVAHFAQCIRGGTAPAIGTADDARRALAAALAARESCATGQPIRLAPGPIPAPRD